MKNILILVGEPSGDAHAAKLITEVREKDPSVHFVGMGQDKMKAAGAEIVVHSKELALFGFLEVITHIHLVFKAYYQLKKLLKTRKPDLVILVDYPGFNLRFAKLAKKAGVKVLYYISPQLWAWHKNRIKKVKAFVDEMALIFPFEVDFYKKHEVKASFVGHPLTQAVKPMQSLKKNQACFNLQDKSPVIGLLPGSRRSEIRYLLPILLNCAKILKNTYPNAHFILPLASESTREWIEKAIDQYPKLDIQCVENKNLYDAMSICDVSISASGTVTLELGLLGTPTVLIYKVHPISAWIAKRLLTLSYVGICNIVMNKEVMREYLQENAKPAMICEEVKKLLENPGYRASIQNDLKYLKQLLSEDSEQSESIAHLILGGN